ncbi:MAG: sensor histidine kinase, partial [Sulfurimonas sp.]|nr:sensor histidine kinase [Sulfurimonas sp.]
DNGIKYSEDSRVVIKTDTNKIIFENRGKELLYELEAYYEPFFKGDNVKSNQSFGLGLYIVKNILNANEYKLKYEHIDGVNSFILEKN